MQTVLRSLSKWTKAQAGFVVAIVLLFGATSPARSQQSSATPEPTKVDQRVTPVAQDFRAPQRPLPEMNRVGIDPSQQHPLSLREAISMALENNKDIEVARENVRIAEFDLLG